MKNTKAIAMINIFKKLQLLETVLLLGLSISVPFLMHFIPSSSAPIGAVLMPIFFAPFIAILFFRLHVAVITALVTPMLNYFITGMPAFELVGIITTEITLFVLILKLFINFKSTKYFAAPISLVIAAFCAQMVIGSFAGFKNAITTGLPGIILLLLLNIAVLKFIKSDR